MAILYGFAVHCLFCVVFLHKAKAGDCLQSQLTNLSCIKELHTDTHHESPKSLRPGQCNISSPRRAACGFMFVSANMQFNRVVDMLLDLSLFI